MTDGGGDEHTVVFTAAGGAFIRGLYHEPPMRTDHGGLRPGLLDGLPAHFQRQVDEPPSSTSSRSAR